MYCFRAGTSYEREKFQATPTKQVLRTSSKFLDVPELLGIPLYFLHSPVGTHAFNSELTFFVILSNCPNQDFTSYGCRGI